MCIEINLTTTRFLNVKIQQATKSKFYASKHIYYRSVTVGNFVQWKLDNFFERVDYVPKVKCLEFENYVLSLSPIHI